MAEEMKDEPVVTASEEPTTENNQGGGSGQNQRGGRRGDETPIEELFDLTQPIPKVAKPSKDSHDREIAEINAALDKLKEERAAIQAKIDAAMDSGRNSEVGKEREALSQLRAKKGALIDEKKAIRVRMDASREQADRLAKDRKDAKSGVSRGFGSIAEIDAEIARLQRRQETTSMSLTEEKRLIKEMDALQASKGVFADIQKKETSLEDVKEQRKAIQKELNAKDEEINAVQAQIDERNAAMQAHAEKETDKRGAIKALFAERDEIKQKTNEKHKQRDSARQTYREANNAWYNYQRAIRAKKKLEYEAEKKAREEERQAWLKAKEEEESKKIPYEEEQALCEYLASYLEKTFLTDEAEKKKQEEAAVAEKKKADVVAVDDDPFAKFKPVSKKSDDSEYFTLGKKKKVRQRNKEKKEPGPFRLNVDTFEQFGLIGLNPPTRLDMVEASVKELREKKEWYKVQPRGSVPTATAIRKENEKAAAKLRSSTSNGSDVQAGSGDVSAKKPAAAGNFALSSDDFAPLAGAGGASSSVNASWGQAKPEATTTEEETS